VIDEQSFWVDGAFVDFHKNVTYLIHSMVVGVWVKRRKGAEIGRTIGLGSDDF